MAWFLRSNRTDSRRLHYHDAPHQGRVVRGRVLQAGLALLVVFVFGVGGYWLIGQGAWSFGDCAYMVLITITTVGYAEVLPVSASDAGRLFTMVLLVSGMGVSLYFLSALTAFIVEGDLREDIDHGMEEGLE